MHIINRHLLLLIPIIGLTLRHQALRERVLVDVVLVVKLWHGEAAHSFRRVLLHIAEVVLCSLLFEETICHQRVICHLVAAEGILLYWTLHKVILSLILLLETMIHYWALGDIRGHSFDNLLANAG